MSVRIEEDINKSFTIFDLIYQLIMNNEAIFTMAERVHLFTTPNLLHATPNPFHATPNSLHVTPNLFHATLNTIENGQRYVRSGQ